MSIFTDFAQNMATFQGVDIDPLPTLVDNCPDIVYEKEIFGLRGDIGLYTVHFGRGPEPKRILEGEFTFCDQIRVTSNLSVINVIEVPIHISGVVGAALNIGDLTNDLAQAELYLSGNIADQSIGPFRVKVDSTDPGFAGVILPEERSISESRTIQLEVPPEGREFEIQITGGFKATSSAKADGLFGLLTAASTAYIFFPSSIYVGNFRGLNGGPVPDGITIRSLKTGAIYNPKPGNSNTPVSVPNVGGLTESAAVSLLASRGLASNCTNFYTYHDAVEVGYVIKQAPPAGQQIEGGSCVFLLISRGLEPTANVPDIVGLTLTDAAAALVAAGFAVGHVSTENSTTVAGSVIRQQPDANTTVKVSTSVDLVISLGPSTTVSVPNVVGLPQAAANTALSNAGLAIGNVASETSASVPAGSVINQQPAAGSSVEVGTSVDLVVSVGASNTANVPDVVGLPQTAANTALTKAGLVMGAVTTESSASVSAGLVISQQPGAGTEAPIGSSVDLVVSSGAPISVPNIVGLAQTEAISAIIAARLNVGTIIIENNSNISTCNVFSQNPSAGAQAILGDKVDLITSGQNALCENLLINGSFEEGPDPSGELFNYVTLFQGNAEMPGWIVTKDSVDIKGTLWSPTDGFRCIDLNGTPGLGAIAQNFSTAPGENYLVVFDLASNPSGGPPIRTMQVDAAGQSAQFSFDSTGKSGGNMGWITQEWRFTANQPKTTLQFSSLTRNDDSKMYGPAIDRVRLYRDFSRRYGLTVTKIGTGSGTVASDPSGISCGVDCSEIYTADSIVNLTIIPSAGSTFEGWSGACAGTGTCAVSMTAAKGVTAALIAASNWTLTLNKVGNGDITSDPAGINCGTDCSENYARDVTVTLKAVPANGWKRSLGRPWQGCNTSDGTTCTVIMNAAKTVTATFNPVLQVTHNGNGVIASVQPGIDCGADCENSYALNSDITLTATPAAGFILTSWGSACTGTAATCTVKMSEPKNVMATFSIGATLPGDVNGDSSVNALDVVAVINVVLSLSSLPAADVNKDGSVNALDVVFVINKVLGL